MSPTNRPQPVLAFDGDCGFCQAVINQISAHGRPTMHAVPWQFLPDTATEPHRARLDHEVLLLRHDQVIASGAQALATYMRHSPRRRFQLAGAAIQAPLLRNAAQYIYRWVARHRHRMPAGTPACAIPPTRP
ncbi:DCC1-like thiol-disulfide oxidoreductase family protein [Streptomyces sp. NPDC032472]|uniref:thiol-disulfide oxidoreductase DCC family protein n=1 Tax=Streptomyces sp. NPDC032472 TaxID=3155018 RepID=UPI0033C0D0CE